MGRPRSRRYGTGFVQGNGNGAMTPREGVPVGELPAESEGTPSSTRSSLTRRPSRPVRRDSITISYEARRYLELVAVEPPVIAGARNALETCLSLVPGGRLLLCCTAGEELVGSACVHAANEMGVETTTYVVTEEQATQEGFVARLAANLEDVDASIYVGRSNEAMRPIQVALSETGPERKHAELLDVTEAMMRQSVRADIHDTHALGTRLVTVLGRAGTLDVLGGPGTELQIGYGGETPWTNASGRVLPGMMTALPEGRVWARPTRVDGAITADGAVWLPDGSSVARSSTLKLRFERGTLIAAEGADAAIFLDATSRIDHGRRVCRVVFGTNVGVLTSIGERSQDLLMPGVHLLLGASASHIASIAIAPRRPDVSTNGTPILVRGRYARTLLD
jgi:hypothetical protein